MGRATSDDVDIGQALADISKKPAVGRGADRQRQLLAAAVQIFRTQGYDATSLQDLADAIGIQKGSVYHYIRTKEDLLFAIIDNVHKQMFRLNVAWMAPEGDPLQRIRSFIEGHVKASVANLEGAEIYFRDFRALNAEHKASIIEIRDVYEGQLRSLIQDAAEQGELRPQIDPAFATRMVFGMINWVFFWYRPAGPSGLDELIDEIGTYAIASLT